MKSGADFVHQSFFMDFNAAVAAIAGLEPREMAVYPSGDAYDLRAHIAETLNLSPEQVICGNGANEIIQFAISAYCEAGATSSPPTRHLPSMNGSPSFPASRPV